MTHKRRLFVRIFSIISILALVITILVFSIGYYNKYLNDQLYMESVSQLEETTTQMFEKLDVQLEEQWRYVSNVDKGCPQKDDISIDELSSYLALMQSAISPNDSNIILYALDNQGYYYSAKGKQGLWGYADKLTGEGQRANGERSFIISDWMTNENYMAFVVQSSKSTNVGDRLITHYILLRSMEDMSPFFQSTAYNLSNTTFVVDDGGVRLFAEIADDNLDFAGHNLFFAFREQVKFNRIKDFDEYMSLTAENNVVCTDVTIGDKDYYICTKDYEGYDWFIINFIPSNEVASSTRDMVMSVSRLFLLIISIIVLISLILILILMRYRQNSIILESKAQNEKLLTEANRKLSESQATATVAMRQAEAASKAKTDFLSNMSHDIRTPMNAIVNISRIMKREVNSPEKIDAYCDKIITSSEFLLGIINDVLDINKIESGKTIINSEKTNLAEIICKVDTLIGSQAAEKNQTFHTKVSKVLYENVYADPVRLNQILVNILNNAVKYTGEGGKIDFSVIGFQNNEDGYESIHFVVEDNGMGISEEYLPRIFEPFTRQENSITNKIQGTGLGMAITKNVVDMMGGTICVKSKEGEGTTFEVILKFKTAKPDKLPFDGKVKNVITVCKDKELAENIHNVFNANGIFSVNIDDAQGADEYIKNAKDTENPFRIILAEYDEYISEIDCFKSVRQKNDVLLIVIGNKPHDAVTDILKAGAADGYMELPFFITSLEREVANILDDRSVATSESAIKGLHFLCVEDNDLNTEIISTLLGMEGATCDVCENGKKAVDVFLSSEPDKYDIILMDIQMPIMNGYEATKIIRNSGHPSAKTVPIIAMTANAFSEDVQQAVKSGMNAHMSKPIDMEKLNSIVENIKQSNTPPPEN